MRRGTWIRWAALGLIGLLVCGVGLAAAVTLPRRDAIRCLLAFSGAPPGDDGALLARQRVVVGDEARLGFRTVLVQAAPQTPAPVLVFVHGVAQKGLTDARILQAVDSFAQAGFTVVAPQVPLLVSPPDADDDERRLQTLMASVEAGLIPGGKPGRFGLIGVRVGGALSLRAASSYAGSGLRAVFAIGAPDDLRTLSRIWFSLPRTVDAGTWTFEDQRRHDAAFARNVVFRAALGTRVPDVNDQVVLRAWLEHATDPTFVPATLRSDAARRFAALVTSGPGTWADAREDLVEDAWPLMRGFSTASVGPRLSRLSGITVFLLHGHGDSLVPASEYRRLRDRLAAHTVVVGLESRMLGHVGVEDVGIGEQLDHVVLVDDFFDTIR